jgi:hypothetical protein
LSGHHVIQEDDVDTLNLNESSRLFQIVSLNFNANVGPFFPKLADLIGEPGQSSERGKMIVLYQDHVVEPGTVINAATSQNRGFFQHAKPGRRFAGIKYFGRMIANRINELVSKRCNAGQALKEI